MTKQGQPLAFEDRLSHGKIRNDENRGGAVEALKRLLKVMQPE